MAADVPREDTPEWARGFWNSPEAAVARPRSQNAEPSTASHLPLVVRWPELAGSGAAIPFEKSSSWHRPTCREYYSGDGRLSAALRARGYDTVEFEAMKIGKVLADRESGNPNVIDQ